MNQKKAIALLFFWLLQQCEEKQIIMMNLLFLSGNWQKVYGEAARNARDNVS